MREKIRINLEDGYRSRGLGVTFLTLEGSRSEQSHVREQGLATHGMIPGDSHFGFQCLGESVIYGIVNDLGVLSVPEHLAIPT